MAQRRILASLFLLTFAAPAFAQTPSQAGAQAGAQAPGARAPAPPSAMPAPTESRIHIVSATLGKNEINKTCDVSATVTRQCEGKSRCQVTASNTLCDVGTTPPDVLIATLRIVYRCAPQDTPRTVTADRPLDLTVVCRRRPPPVR